MTNPSQVTGDSSEGTPPSRGLHSLTKVGDSLMLFGGAPQSGPMVGFHLAFLDKMRKVMHMLDEKGGLGIAGGRLLACVHTHCGMWVTRRRWPRKLFSGVTKK